MVSPCKYDLDFSVGAIACESRSEWEGLALANLEVVADERGPRTSAVWTTPGRCPSSASSARQRTADVPVQNSIPGAQESAARRAHQGAGILTGHHRDEGN
jgi:hypothetical protein